jgi:hypothetical protein
LKAAQYSVTNARQETTKLQTKQDNDLRQQRDELLAKHREDIETLNKKADGDAEQRKKLSARVDKLKTSNEKVGSLIENKESEGKISEQETEIESLKNWCKQLYSPYGDQKLKSHSWAESYRKIEEEVENLEEKHDLQLLKQKPLLLVGFAIRKRFLEQSRSVLPPHANLIKDQEVFESRGSGDKAIIDLGNATAHFGNSDADFFLFTCGFLNEGEQVGPSKYAGLFKAIYQLKPQESHSHQDCTHHTYAGSETAKQRS